MPTLYRNGLVSGAAAAFVVDGGTLAWVGNDDAAADQVGIRVVDLAGSLVTPAFVDAHVHATSTGLALTGLDLRHAATLAEALGAVERAARVSRGRPILGGGWDESAWPEQRPPTARELDRAAYGGVVYLARVDVHSAVVSSSLMAAIRGLPGLSGFGADGWQRGSAHDAVRTEALAAITAGQRRAAQLAALRHAASLGIACVHEMAGPVISSADDLAALLAPTESDGPLPEVIGYWAELFGVATACELGAVGAAGDLFCDGSLGSHTAALHTPYADRPDTTGLLRFETADVAAHIEQCVHAGVQAGFHAIGDAAVDQVLDAFEIVSARLGRPIGPGHRIEHAEYVRDPARLAASGLTASMQPCFDARWGGADGMYAARLGPDRASRLNRFADLVAAGVPIAFGSDSPVTPLGPWAAVRAATAPHVASSAVDLASAIKAHTTAGWRAADRRREGVFEPGAPATFAVWQGDLGTETPACVTTVRDGLPIFDAGLLS